MIVSKSALIKCIPRPIKRVLRAIHTRLVGLDGNYRGKDTAEIFDKVYKSAAWGTDQEGNPTSGSGSSTDEVVAPYVSKVREFLKAQEFGTVVDLGCGDFTVGRQLADLSDRYIACDVSNVILEQNRAAYDLRNVAFSQLDITSDALPTGDIAFVRQVLQHLSNIHVQAFVDTLNTAKPYRYLLVTEHVPAKTGFTPNLDKPSGPSVRVSIDSGIELHEAPFNLDFKTREVFLEVSKPTAGRDALIKTTLYEL